ncbi:MAG TPA: PH domain-containing protein [Pyrinomonadaceae bacterium]|nr:PH domain-containing protein [Pyrinomonadaceae bacterium]
MGNCQQCGTPLTPGARFCAACAAPVNDADPEATRVSTDFTTDFGSEETRVAASRPRPVQSQPMQVRPLAPAAVGRAELLAQEDEEKTIFTVRPTLLFVKLGYLLAALGGLLLVALLAWVPWFTTPFYVSIPLALALLLLPAYKHLMRNSVQYRLTDAKIEIDRGFVSRTTRNIPLRNIQDVSVTTSIPQRLLRFGNVVIDNASEASGETVLRNIPDPRRHADQILRELRRWH